MDIQKSTSGSFCLNLHDGGFSTSIVFDKIEIVGHSAIFIWKKTSMTVVDVNTEDGIKQLTAMAKEKGIPLEVKLPVNSKGEAA